MKTRIEYFSKFSWYGYEGIGHSKEEYLSDNIEDLIEFQKFATQLLGNNTIGPSDDYSEKWDKFFRWYGNGYVVKLDGRIMRRTIIEEEVIDVKKETRKVKLEKIITDMK